MKILVTGCDGYIGWPTFLKLCFSNKRLDILGIDNFSRRKWVKEVNSKSKIRIFSMKERLKELNKYKLKNKFKFKKIDLTNQKKIKNLIKNFKPNVILHLAAQPSAPYANTSIKKCIFTTQNNNIGTLNLLWSLKELNLEKKVKFISTTTTGVYGTPNFPIPEGYLEIRKTKLPISSMGGSWYHITKSNDCNYFWLANRLWGMSIYDFRTAITLGTSTVETRKNKYFTNRFDDDFYFGVVVNRFVANSIRGKPILIYGKGEQKKPFIHLKDAVDSLYNSINLKLNNKYNVYNQFSETVSIKDIAKIIKNLRTIADKKIIIKHIENPRVENETHKMIMKNENFLKVLKRRPFKVSEAIADTKTDLQNING